MRIIPSSTSSEHWLTLMTCTICAHSPDSSPIYKCSMGHTICYPCFRKLVSTGIPICNMCESDKFTRQDVSTDFLKKLKTKPGIGRPHRYSLASRSMKGDTDHYSEPVTVEKLFQLPSKKLRELFDDSTKEKLRYFEQFPRQRNSTVHLKNEKRDMEVNTNAASVDTPSKLWLKTVAPPPQRSHSLLNFESSSPTISRKPLKCPHDPCNKIIAVSSFQSHFTFEHCDFKRYNLERGKELMLGFNPGILEHGRTLCLGIIKLFENVVTNDYNNSNISKIANKFTKKVPVDSFWVMVSASPEDRPSFAYAIIWLFTCNDEFYNCTLELCAPHDSISSTTFCGVNGIHESQNITQIAQRLNCLYLTYGTLKSMLSYGVHLKLRIAIH